MASLTAKTINGRKYYYLRECAWVDGKPKIVKQIYLGTADAIAAALGKSPSPFHMIEGAPVLDFGGVAALYDLATRLDLVALIDKHVPKRKGKAPSVGAFLVLAAINRAVAASSKAKFATWFDRTSLPRLTGFSSAQFSSQRFWDNMDRVKPKTILKIEEELTRVVVERYSLDLRCLFYDATNFFTFIDTFNDRPKMPQRGKSKEGRSGLRILGLALLVTGDFQVPLFHHLYPGNENDPTSFRSVVGDLVNRYRAMTEGAQDVTLVFDKGNNTEDTVEALMEVYHVVGSLVPTHHKDLLKVPRSRFERLDVDQFPDEVSCYRTEKVVFGREFLVLVTYNENLFRTQSMTIAREVAKRQAKLRAYQRSLSRWLRGKGRGRRPSVASVQKAVDKILAGQHMKTLFRIDISPDPKAGDMPALKYRFDHRAYDKLKRHQLGKTLLFTDNKDWSNEEIVTAYRGQHHVENCFRQMKDIHYVSFRPSRHWTDQKLQVHAFTCVLALLLTAVLRCELAQREIAVSTNRMLEALGTIREVHVLHTSGRGRPRLRRTHSDFEPLAKEIFTALDLGRLLPT